MRIGLSVLLSQCRKDMKLNLHPQTSGHLFHYTQIPHTAKWPPVSVGNLESLKFEVWSLKFEVLEVFSLEFEVLEIFSLKSLKMKG